MNVVRLALFAACCIAFLPLIAEGLTCYSCVACVDPFNKNNATIVSTNSSSQSCYKIVAASVASRGAMDGCVQSNILGTGTWCCNTDLCNSAPSILSMRAQILIGFSLFICSLFK